MHKLNIFRHLSTQKKQVFQCDYFNILNVPLLAFYQDFLFAEQQQIRKYLGNLFENSHYFARIAAGAEMT